MKHSAIISAGLMILLIFAWAWMVNSSISRLNKRLTSAESRLDALDKLCARPAAVLTGLCSLYARDIGSAVSVCDDPEKLRQIAAIIGKELNK